MNQAFLDSEIAAVKSVIHSEAKITDPDARAAINDLVDAGGKFLRPKILILSAMTGKYNPEVIRPLAAAIELLHTATLLHDDVIDDSPSRRGIPAAHVRIGRKAAVLSGDYLFSRCFRLAARETSPENASGLASAISLIVSAELEQDAGRWKFSPSKRSCYRKIGGKTAVLFSLAARAGAVEAKASQSVVSSLTRSAWAAGVAFQIQDDILDWQGNESELGKTVMNDLAEGFCTLPLAFALSSDQESLLPLLSPEAVHSGSSGEVLNIVRKSGALERSSDLAKVWCERSLRNLAKIPASFARDELSFIFSSFVDRKK